MSLQQAESDQEQLPERAKHLLWLIALCNICDARQVPNALFCEAATKATGLDDNFGVNADAVRQTNADKLGFYLQDIFANSKNQSTGQTSVTGQILRLGGKYDRNITDKWYGFGALDYEHDKLAGVKNRVLPQLGLGYHVIKSDPLTFDVFGGVAYNRTEFYTDPTYNKAEFMFGEESIHKISATTTFRQRLAVFAPFSDASDKYRLQFDAGLATAIIGGWNLVVNFTDRYNQAPASGKKKNDMLIFTGLQYAWGPK